MPTLYEILHPMKEPLQKAYQLGAGVSSTLLRDLDIYAEFQRLKLSQMNRYAYLSIKHNITEKRVQQIIKKLNTKTNDNHQK